MTPPTIPLTPIAKRYRDLAKSYRDRVDEATSLVASPEKLVDEFHQSIDVADRFFETAGNDRSGDAFHEDRPQFGDHIEPGLTSTASLCRLLSEGPCEPEVLGDTEKCLGFRYVDHELVSTRAPGFRLEGDKGSRTTRDGPRMDLLLAKQNDRVPIIGEVKLTTRTGERGRWAPDKDPFYALIQALASAAYILPRKQFARLGQHYPRGTFSLDQRRVGLYLLIGRAPEASKHWFELRDCAQRLSEAIAPGIAEYVDVIAGLDLEWFEHRPASSRLRITKWFAQYPASRENPREPAQARPSASAGSGDEVETARRRRERAANKYRPRSVDLLLVAEAPPAVLDRYFYFEDVREQDALFRYVVRGILEMEPTRETKREHLAALRDRGVFLIDIKQEPTSKSPLIDDVPDLIRRVRALKPRAIILIKATVYDAAYTALRDAGLSVVEERVPFPGSGQQRRFEAAFARALRREQTMRA